MLEERLEQDIKKALLAGDSTTVSTLRQLKSVLLNVKVATGKRDSGLKDEEVIPLLVKECKKRQESADLYLIGGNKERADMELNEKKVIEAYLPESKSEDEIVTIIDSVISETDNIVPKILGQVIGKVKSIAGPTADGALIARLVKEKLGI